MNEQIFGMQDDLRALKERPREASNISIDLGLVLEPIFVEDFDSSQMEVKFCRPSPSEHLVLSGFPRPESPP
jgi:hypothetical protein